MILYCLTGKLRKRLWSMILKVLRLPSHINAGSETMEIEKARSCGHNCCEPIDQHQQLDSAGCRV